jgi:adenylate cyclase
MILCYCTRMSKAEEVERAFLPSNFPEGLRGVLPTELVDIYLSPADDLLRKLRLRQQNSVEHELSKKVIRDPRELSVQDEYTIPLTSDEFALFGLLGGRALVKDRYVLGSATGPNAEVDIFKGPLRGLVLVEFEFPNEAARDTFAPPDYCAVEVTQEDFISGAYLAGHRYEEIEPELKRLGYQPMYFN